MVKRGPAMGVDKRLLLWSHVPTLKKRGLADYLSSLEAG
jgi:hypothetical protein